MGRPWLRGKQRGAAVGGASTDEVFAAPSRRSKEDDAPGLEQGSNLAEGPRTCGRSRPLALRLLRQDYQSLDEEDRGEASRTAAEALGQMLALKDTSTDQIDQIGREISNSLDLPSLIKGLADDHRELDGRFVRLDPKSRHRERLIPMLEQLRLSRGSLFSVGDLLGFASLIEPSATGQPKLAIVSPRLPPRPKRSAIFCVTPVGRGASLL